MVLNSLYWWSGPAVARRSLFLIQHLYLLAQAWSLYVVYTTYCWYITFRRVVVSHTPCYVKLLSGRGTSNSMVV